MSDAVEHLVWVDCEMTGLDLEKDELVEIAVVITDYELKVVDPGIDIIIKPNQAALDGMGDFVRNMHETSGLLTELDGGVTLEQAETAVLEYIARFVPSGERPPLGGNSIGTDRGFIAKFMPKLNDRLHYRNVDVSSVKELAKRWYPRAYYRSPDKVGGHRALADILESIQELAYYRSTIFVPQPGPTTDECKEVAAALVQNSASTM